MSSTAVTRSTTFLDVNQMLTSHSNPVVRLMTRSGIHYFETMESFPRRLGLGASMESAGITADSHIRFKIPFLGGSPSPDSKYICISHFIP